MTDKEQFLDMLTGDTVKELSMLEGQNIVVLDLETAKSADSCRFCDRAQGDHFDVQMHNYAKIGWDDKAALGLSIGCMYLYRTDSYVFFDQHTLEETMQWLVKEQPLLVSFNGLHFDFSLMRALLRDRANCSAYAQTPVNLSYPDVSTHPLHRLCDEFKELAKGGYDVLAALWRAGSACKFERGLNSLDVISRVNGFGAKEMDGAMAPRLWAQGEYARVINYNMNDVVKTRKLFEMICAGLPILRGDGRPIQLPVPEIPSSPQSA